MDYDMLVIVAALVMLYVSYRAWRSRRSCYPPLLEAVQELRDAGYHDIAVEAACAHACLDPETEDEQIDRFLAKERDNPAHRPSLIAAYESLMKPYPAAPGWTYATAYLYHLDGRDAEANTLIERALAAPADGDRWRAHMRQFPGDLAWHTKYYEDAHKDAPDDLDTRYKLAYIYQFSGRFDEAAGLIGAPVELVKEVDPWRIRLMDLQDELQFS